MNIQVIEVALYKTQFQRDSCKETHHVLIIPLHAQLPSIPVPTFHSYSKETYVVTLPFPIIYNYSYLNYELSLA